MDLRNRFASVCADLEIPSDGYFEILDDLYRGRLRFYHNWNHIESVLDRIDVLWHLTEQDDHALALVKFAAFYHDAIYVPGFSENERLSAELAMAHFELTGSMGTTSLIHRWIMATKTHQTVRGDIGAEILIDADLYELGTDRYGINGLNVRREFGAFSDLDWRIGRAKFLDLYSNREPLLALPTQDEVERRAKANMKAELASL